MGFTENFKNDDDNGFTEFYDTQILWSRNGEDVLRLSVCIMDDTTDDSIADDTIDTQRKTISIIVPSKDFRHIGNMKRGDDIKVLSNCDFSIKRDYKIVEVKDDFALGFVIRARESSSRCEILEGDD